MQLDRIGCCENDGDATTSESNEQGDYVLVEEEAFPTEGFVEQDRAR